MWNCAYDAERREVELYVQKRHARFGEDCIWDGHQFKAFMQQRERGGAVEGTSIDKLTRDIRDIMAVCVQVLCHPLASTVPVRLRDAYCLASGCV